LPRSLLASALGLEIPSDLLVVVKIRISSFFTFYDVINFLLLSPAAMYNLTRPNGQLDHGVAVGPLQAAALAPVELLGGTPGVHLVCIQNSKVDKGV